MVRILPLIALFLSFLGTCLAQVNLDESLSKARELERQKKYKDALSILKPTIKANPNCGQCYIEMGLINIRLRQIDDANTAFDKASKVNDSNAVLAQAHMYKAFILMGSDKKALQQAESELRQAISLDDGVAGAHLNLGIVLIRQAKDDEGMAEVRKSLAVGGDPANIAMANKILANPRVARDQLAPDFNVTTLDGQQVSLAENAGKIVVIDFWATWCPPCRDSVPEIKELVKKYPSDKLVVLSASADRDEQSWREFVTKKEMSWPQYWDKDGKLAELLGVEAYPTYIVIDRDGFISKRLVGMNPRESIAHKLRTELKSLLE